MAFHSPTSGPLNAVLPTLGGRQFWADELFFHDWHIQRNSFTGHCRLLDGGNHRHAWGNFEQCRAKLDALRGERHLPAMCGTGVVVLHGLFRSAAAMSGISHYLHAQGGYEVFNVNYPTTRGTLHEHAQQLAGLLAGLEGIDKIHFVAHSLGNLVIRQYLAESQASGGSDPRIGRIVMLGPPNQGAQMAETLSNLQLFHVVAGASASQLGRDWPTLSKQLATPACQFGIVAGGRGKLSGFNPLLGEDNDLVVTVESARLAGAADFLVVPVLHTFLMDDPKVQECTLRFLDQGCFISPAECHPILADPA